MLLLTKLNKIDIKNSKHFMLLLCCFLGGVSLYPLLSDKVEYNEKLFIFVWAIIMLILLVIYTLLLNKYHIISHSLFWFFYFISIFFINSYQGKIFLLLLSLSVIMCWQYFMSIGRSGCPLVELYDRSSYNTSLKDIGSIINNVIYIYSGYLIIDIFIMPLVI